MFVYCAVQRQKLEDFEGNSSSGEEAPEREDEKPQIVVLKAGDLDAEQVEKEQKRLAKGKNSARKQNVLLRLSVRLLFESVCLSSLNSCQWCV